MDAEVDISDLIQQGGGQVPTQRSCPKCDGYLGIVVHERKEAGDQ
jgi:hypothetical protein